MAHEDSGMIVYGVVLPCIVITENQTKNVCAGVRIGSMCLYVCDKENERKRKDDSYGCHGKYLGKYRI